MELSQEFTDPLAVVELLTYLEDISFPSAGEYRVQLHVDGELLIERRIEIIAVE